MNKKLKNILGRIHHTGGPIYQLVNINTIESLGWNYTNREFNHKKMWLVFTKGNNTLKIKEKIDISYPGIGTIKQYHIEINGNKNTITDLHELNSNFDYEQ